MVGCRTSATGSQFVIAIDDYFQDDSAASGELAYNLQLGRH
jgi:hypothetical protein